jgi:catechol 2,3-dioxygenase-like lactoylglutathione lyase family enzyme
MSMTDAAPEVKLGAWALALSHGTLECRDLAASRRFYSEFLGLDTVRRGEMAIWFRCGGSWMVASVGTGEKQESLPIDSRWCLDMATADEVDAAHEAATGLAAEYGIMEILPLQAEGAERSFCLRDLDGNWWEICHRKDRLYDGVFGDALS